MSRSTLSDADARVPWNRPVDGLLEVLHHHVEQSVIDLWFKYGWLPPERPSD